MEFSKRLTPLFDDLHLVLQSFLLFFFVFLSIFRQTDMFVFLFCGLVCSDKLRFIFKNDLKLKNLACSLCRSIDTVYDV